MTQRLIPWSLFFILITLGLQNPPSASAQDATAAFANRAAHDTARPRFHFSPSVFWLNDPNGLIQHRGVYHLFYQYSDRPEGPDMVKHWGHAISRDLVDWTERPIALSPSPQGPDSTGCWSGSAIQTDGIVRIFYTGVLPESQCMATAQDDSLETWTKSNANPILASPPPGLPVISFRDPTLWRDGDWWCMGVATGIQKSGGAVLGYRSKNFTDWEYTGLLFADEQNQYSYLFECPSFFSLGDKKMLIYSGHTTGGRLGSYYFLGTYADFKFQAQSYGTLDFSPDYYAAQAFTDENGRTLVMAWLKSGRQQETWPEYGWSGAISFPRELSLGPDGSVHIQPVREIERYRGERQTFSGLRVTTGSQQVLGSLSSDQAEIQVTFTPDAASGFAASRFGLKVCCSPAGQEKTLIYYDTAQQQLVLDRTASSLSAAVIKDTQQTPLALDPGQPLTLRVFVDHSIIEVYANDTVAGTIQVYPILPGRQNIDLFVQEGTVQAQADVWPLIAPGQ